MANGVSLLIEKSNWLIDGLPDGYRLKITASESTFGTNAIFRWRKLPLQPSEDEETIVCDGVCSPADLSEYPEFTTRPSDEPPYFRLDYVDLILRSKSTAEETLRILQEEVLVLVNALDQLEITEDSSTVVIGELSEGSSSSEL